MIAFDTSVAALHTTFVHLSLLPLSHPASFFFFPAEEETSIDGMDSSQEVAEDHDVELKTLTTYN